MEPKYLETLQALSTEVSQAVLLCVSACVCFQRLLLMENLQWRRISKRLGAYLKANPWSRLDMEHPIDRAVLEQTPGCEH